MKPQDLLRAIWETVDFPNDGFRDERVVRQVTIEGAGEATRLRFVAADGTVLSIAADAIRVEPT